MGHEPEGGGSGEWVPMVRSVCKVTARPRPALPTGHAGKGELSEDVGCMHLPEDLQRRPFGVEPCESRAQWIRGALLARINAVHEPDAGAAALLQDVMRPPKPAPDVVTTRSKRYVSTAALN
jgi:hypothetical protein